MTWMASKLGGLNIKKWLQPRKERPPRSHRVEACGKPTHYPEQRKIRNCGSRFTALLHHICNLETLRMAYFALKKEAAPGVDGETWRHYGEKLGAISKG
jgi:hypothetical protein